MHMFTDGYKRICDQAENKFLHICVNTRARYN